MERLDRLANVPQEAALSLVSDAELSSWPQHGRIVFNAVHMRYRAGLDTVLRGLDLDIEPGEKASSHLLAIAMLCCVLRVCHRCAG